MKRIPKLLFLPTLLLLSSWALPARAGDSVPLKGTAVTVPTLVDLSTFHFINDGTGEATHLGRIAVHLDNFATPNATLTAANGDQLLMELAFVDFDPATSAFINTYTIVGGTGRFAGATGLGNYLFYDTPGTELNTFDGTIDFKKQ
jgi:hypothetical protein